VRKTSDRSQDIALAKVRIARKRLTPPEEVVAHDRAVRNIDRKARREKRRKRREIPLEDALPEPAVDTLLNDVIAREMVERLLGRGCEQFGPRRLLRALMDGLTIDEMAAVIGASKATTKRRLAGARADALYRVGNP
jgi:hypothetical protein